MNKILEYLTFRIFVFELISGYDVHKVLYLSAVHGDGETRSKAYQEYVERVLEVATKQCFKSLIGLRTCFLSRIERYRAL